MALYSWFHSLTLFYSTGIYNVEYEFSAREAEIRDC